jgi:phosphoribosyl-ATP pyrophosphohydrolase
VKDFDKLWLELNELVARKDDTSHTVKALAEGTHQIGKKVVEEAAEVWMAAEHESDERLAEEISQLLYHVQVLMLSTGVKPEQVYKYL